MFATFEEKIIVAALTTAIVLVGLLGFIRHERSTGAAVCVQQDLSADLAQSKKETADARAIVTDLDSQVAALSAATVAPASLRVCNVQASRVSPRTSTGSTEPATLPHREHDSGLQTGSEPGVDIGPAVQDITLGCVLGITDATELWSLALKEATQP